MELLKLNWEEKTSAEYFKIKKLKSSIDNLNKKIPDDILFCYVDSLYFKKFLAQDKEGLSGKIYSVSSITHCRNYLNDEVFLFNHYKDENLLIGSYLYGLFDRSIKNVVYKDLFSILYCKDNFIKKIIDNTSSNKWAEDAKILFNKCRNKEL